MNRPSNWYDMDYSQQREWERHERKHEEAREDAEREARTAREEAESIERRARAKQAALREEIGYLEEAQGELAGEVAKLKRFLQVKGLSAEYLRFERPERRHLSSDEGE